MVAKLRNMVSLSFLQYTKDIPESIYLNHASLDVIGLDPCLDHLVTGVCGMHSKEVALQLAAKWTRENTKHPFINRLLMVDVNYKVDNYSLTRQQTRRDILEKTGWLNMDRIATAFRNEIKEMWLDWIDKESPFGVAQALENESLLDIAVQYPKYVRRMMLENPAIKGIVHPVNPVLYPSTCIWAATVRSEPERFHGAVVRCLPRVNVFVGVLEEFEQAIWENREYSGICVNAVRPDSHPVGQNRLKTASSAGIELGTW